MDETKWIIRKLICDSLMEIKKASAQALRHINNEDTISEAEAQIGLIGDQAQALGGALLTMIMKDIAWEDLNEEKSNGR